MDEEGEEQRRIEAAIEAARKLDEFDAELSGTVSGRIAKHLPEDHSSKPGARQRRAEKARAHRMTLEMLLAGDPAYRAAHEQAMGTLQDLEAQTEVALTAVRAAIETETDALDEMRGRGSVLPDGRKVYRDDNGDAFTEDGEKIDGPALDGVVWRDDAPSYEEIKAQRERIAQLRQRETNILRYQTDVLGHARARLTDNENPPSREEVAELEKLMKEQANKALATEPEINEPDYSEASFRAALPKP